MREGYSSAVAGGQGDTFYDTWLNSPRYSGDLFDDMQPMAASTGMDMPHLGMGMTHMGMGMSRFGVSTRPADTRPMGVGVGMDVGYGGLDTGHIPQLDPAE